MFCFQCEQTAGQKACTGKMGVCGKQSDTANFQDELTSSLIVLAKLALLSKPDKHTQITITEGLFATITNVNFDSDSIKLITSTVIQEKERLMSKVTTQDLTNIQQYSIDLLWNDNEDIRSLKSLILFGLKGIAAYAYHAMVLDYYNDEVTQFFYKGLDAIGNNHSVEELLPLVLETGRINLICMELLDKANTKTYGSPKPTEVSLTIEKGPFIVVTGHDLFDLYCILKQTEGKGINIYTHGEMLPAHAYPELKEFPHLKGNFGTAWQNQQKEFEHIPAPVLFTTNCIMPVRSSYKDRIFTTALVAYPGMIHIGEKKDFSPVIKKAYELGGYTEDTLLPGINGGTKVVTGFGHEAVLASSDKVVKLVKQGSLKHIFLVGGCDGAKPGRNYYTEFVKQTPKDSLILTLACGKYRFNDLVLGEIDGLPRLMDMGQCNDAYSAIKVALALAQAFKTDVNSLPLSLILSWYEQKAVCILLTLLHLGIKNIFIGPTLPAFISKNILDVLVKEYALTPISTPEHDLQKILGKK